MIRPHVLLVDDNEYDVMLTVAALELSGLDPRVTVVHDGAEAIDYLRGAMGTPELEPSLVLLDINMPRMNGLEFLDELRRDPRMRHLPVVMLTSSNAERDIHTSYSRGSNAYVVKPVSFDGTVEAIRTLTAFWVVLNRTLPGRHAGPGDTTTDSAGPA